MLRSARSAYETQATLAAGAAVAAQRAVRRGPLAVAQIVATYQALAAQQAVAATAAQVTEQGLVAPPVAGVATAALVGVASSGLPLVNVLESAKSLSMIVSTLVSDAGRQASVLSMHARPGITGYVRMLNLPSCSRCVVLAGKFYATNAGFERHPLCDCIHVAVGNEQMAHDLGLVSSPKAYFDSLSPDEQDKAFTQAGAEAIRLGADINQVVNARSGMNTAQINKRGWIPKGRAAREDVLGRPLFTTTAGVTKRGTFGKANAARGPKQLPYRLMPESIVELAGGDPDEARRLLALYGYLL